MNMKIRTLCIFVTRAGLFLILGFTLTGLSPLRSRAADDKPNGLTPHMESLLHWLPDDTETLIVARSVTLPRFDPVKGSTWEEFGVNLATGDFELVGQGKLSKPLRDRKIECVIHGAKNFEGVSSFGSLRSESCAIIVFETDLGEAATDWTAGIRKNAKEVRTLVGREVFVFPSTTAMEPWIKETPWQGTYFVVLNSRTLLCASSDRFLESVLHRVDEAPKSRAFPDDRDEWKHIDFHASVWMLRHLPKVSPKCQTTGASVTFLRDGFRVVYIPKIGSEQNLERMKSTWEKWFKVQEQDDQKLRPQLKVERRHDGTVLVSLVGTLEPDLPNPENLGLGLQLYWLQGQEILDPNSMKP